MFIAVPEDDQTQINALAAGIAIYMNLHVLFEYKTQICITWSNDKISSVNGETKKVCGELFKMCQITRIIVCMKARNTFNQIK